MTYDSHDDLVKELLEQLQNSPSDGIEFDHETLSKLVDRFESVGIQIVPDTRVVWLPRASVRIHEKRLIPQFTTELAKVFPRGQVTVSDVFQGYRSQEAKKIVLGVLIHKTSAPAGSHIVKIGQRSEVQPDESGWKDCFERYNTASQMFMAVNGTVLESERYAVVYQNAYRLFDSDPETESPKPLEIATRWAICDSKPSAQSVEDVIIDLYRELNRCLYDSATVAEPSHASGIYRERLLERPTDSALHRWESDELYRTLRRDAIWLTTARDKPDEAELPRYLDPIDYTKWALAGGHVPRSLVGRAHGDLHGRNILVGIARGKVMQPVIFDYGEMSDENLLTWDFVKLETELKTRIMPDLFHDDEARRALATATRLTRRDGTSITEFSFSRETSGIVQSVADRADRMEFAFQFESLLVHLTGTINSSAAAENALPASQQRPTGHPAIDKALRMYVRIRQEASTYLGFRKGRAKDWCDEYCFALMIYGVLKGKWELEAPQLEWALVSAGVAAAQLGDRGKIQAKRIENPPDTYSTPNPGSHLVPLRWAHVLWKARKYDHACEIIEAALSEFPHAVALKVEYSLCLAAKGNRDEAREMMAPLRDLCHVFNDHEALSRLGRIYKDAGDEAWKIDQPTFESFLASEHPARQLYREAFKFYSEAFEFSQNYFPGINAAMLALLIDDERREQLSTKVEAICRRESITHLDDQFWVYATEGEAALLNGAAAVGFYQAALSAPVAKNLGMIQPVYNQLCRLHWALGHDKVQPVVDLILNHLRQFHLGSLEPGPFGDCQR